jgi:hypothetical protein
MRYEIVRILNAANLIDAESYERCYRTRGAAALAPGHYVVLWDDTVERPAFDEQATYVGPYRSALLATMMLHSYLHSPRHPASPAAKAAGQHAQAA